MRLKKSFELALNILVHSRLRSWLTIIGIVIGIAAVVSIISISEGAQAQLEQRLGDLGADILTVSPGFSRATGFGGSFGPPGGERSSSSSSDQENLTAKDVLVLNSISNVDVATGIVSGSADMSYSGESAKISIRGVDPQSWEKITTEELDAGRYLTKADTFSIVLGGDVVSSTFNKEITINSKVTIEGKSFKVVGITASGRTSYVPIDIARNILDDVGRDEFASISVKIKDVSLADSTVEEIKKQLMRSRGILKEEDIDFTVTNPSEMQATMEETMNTMALFLGAIAAISLLVGGIGIANTMFTSVLEKTKEIGIMKALGTKNKDVLLIFLFNSGLIGFVGGLGGVILGIFGSGLISMMGSTGGGMTRMFGSTLVTPQLLIGALLFSIIIGMVAGAIPAYRASRLNPVDALRYE